MLKIFKKYYAYFIDHHFVFIFLFLFLNDILIPVKCTRSRIVHSRLTTSLHYHRLVFDVALTR